MPIHDHGITEIVAAALPFVTARRRPDGGFAATPMLPATVEDTYHASRILALAAALDLAPHPAGDGMLRAHVARQCRAAAPGGIRTMFQLLWCCRAAGVEPDRKAAKSRAIAAVRAAGSLRECYYAARTLAEILDTPPARAADPAPVAAVLARPWRCADEAWMRLYLANAWNLPLPRPKLAAWFRSAQNPDGGFGFFPGTTSFAENCHFCLRALATLDGEPDRPEAAWRFLVGCRTLSGGFGRKGRCAPFLDITWHALAGLAILAGAAGRAPPRSPRFRTRPPATGRKPCPGWSR